MVLDATKQFGGRLTQERPFGWHAALFPTGYSGIERIRMGAWRDSPIYVRSEGKHGRIHFEGPPAKRVEAEMDAFLDGSTNRRLWTG